MGMITLGLSLGGVAVPAVSWLVYTYDWRTALVIAGVLIWVLGLPLTAVVRHKPEPYGYLPDGEAPKLRDEGGEAGAGTKGEEEAEVNFTPWQALRTLAFWTLGLTFTARHLVTGSVAVHLISYLIQDRNLSALAAAEVLSLMGTHRRARTSHLRLAGGPL